MPKFVPNPEFVAIANAHFAKGGFIRRRKGQRHLEDLLPTFLFQSDLQGHTLTLLGVGQAYDGSGRVVQCEHLAVCTPAGVLVPAYRLEGPQFNICQELHYVTDPNYKG
jgi:hypothetical protein